MYNCWLKRILDVIISLSSLLFLAPLFVVIISILKFTGEGEIFYLQERVGYLNNKFKIFKFATMVKNSSKMGTGSLTLRNDPRVLPFGRFLRKTKINELPQILNVLIGDMSIVGARPQMMDDFTCYPENVKNIIYNSKPGITGIGSIVFRDEERLITNAENPRKFYVEQIAPVKGNLEIWYQNNKSFTTDLKIIIITAFTVVFPNNKVFLNLFFKDLPPID